MPFTLAGGQGGRVTQPNGGSCNGLPGSDGWLRIDSPNLDGAQLELPRHTRGPVLSVPGAVSRTSARVRLQGSPGRVPIAIDGAEPSLVVETSDGSFDLSLEPGIHELCAFVPHDEIGLTYEDVAGLPEGKYCVRIAAVN